MRKLCASVFVLLVIAIVRAQPQPAPALNSALTRAGLPAVPTWAPPVTPACGAK